MAVCAAAIGGGGSTCGTSTEIYGVPFGLQSLAPKEGRGVIRGVRILIELFLLERNSPDCVNGVIQRPLSIVLGLEENQSTLPDVER